MAEEHVGSIRIYPEVGEEFLFFHPKVYNDSLKLLKGSMWFEKQNKNHEIVYRATACIEAVEWLRDTLGPCTAHLPVVDWWKRVNCITEINPIKDLPLFEFQRESVGFLLQRDRAMLSLSPGLGKTLVSITAANHLNIRKILVVAPASLLYMWKSELMKWGKYLPNPIACSISHRTAILDFEVSPLYQDWIITNPETIMRNKDSFTIEPFELMILDESIYYKNKNAKRTKIVKDVAKNIPIVWELTGAPATRYVDDMWSQFNLLNPKAYSSYWRFAEEYCIIDNTPWAKKVAANKRGAENLIKKRFRDIYFARNQDEVLDIPDWIFEEIDLPMTERQEKIYSDLLNQLRAELENEESNTIISIKNHLSKVIRLIQAASNPLLLGDRDSSGKWSAIPELMEFHPGPYIIWTSFIKSAKAITKMLQDKGYRTTYMLGETKPEDRQKIVDSFQAGNLDAIVLGQAVGSFGLTLTAARTAIYVERNYDGSYFQSLHRFRRIGTTRNPVVLLLKSVFKNGEKTIDEVVHNSLDYRVNMIRNLTIGMIKEIL